MKIFVMNNYPHSKARFSKITVYITNINQSISRERVTKYHRPQLNADNHSSSIITLVPNFKILPRHDCVLSTPFLISNYWPLILIGGGELGIEENKKRSAYVKADEPNNLSGIKTSPLYTIFWKPSINSCSISEHEKTNNMKKNNFVKLGCLNWICIPMVPHVVKKIHSCGLTLWLWRL